MARKKKQEEKKPPQRPKNWFNSEIAAVYQRIYKDVANISHEMTGKARELMLQLMDECSVTELEAVNILMRRHIDEYENKYARLKREYDRYYEEREISNEQKDYSA